MATNHNRRNYTPLLRNWVSRMMDENADKLYKTIEQALLDDPVRTLKELSWIQPREAKIDITSEQKVTHEIVQSDVALLRQLREAQEDHVTH